MHIKIHNFGPIHEFEFDLNKDFHVVYGKNNIGKSYAITAVYLILKNVLKRKELQPLDYESIIKSDSINELVSFIITENSKSVFIKKQCEPIICHVLNQTFLPSLQQSFNNTFINVSNFQNRKSNEKFKIEIDFGHFTAFLILKNEQLFFDNIIIKTEILVREGMDKNDNDYFLLPLNSIQYLKEKKGKELLIVLIRQITEITFHDVKHISKEIFFLPASKSGLYEGMNVFSSVFAKLSQLRHLINESIEIPALSEPMSDYFLHLSTIKNNVHNDIYSDFAKVIEEDILGATIQFNHDTKKLEYYKKEQNLKLEISETSSMVSEIAPLVAYLKFIINENKSSNDAENIGKKVIFIEEPEAHLHPEIQVKLVSLFSKLVQHDIKIVLTTHSNYLFNKVNNLILNGDLAVEKVANYHLIDTPEGSIIEANNQVTELGIEDNNFVEVAEKLYNERLQIID